MLAQTSNPQTSAAPMNDAAVSRTSTAVISEARAMPAQDSVTPDEVRFSAYLDAYYAYAFAAPPLGGARAYTTQTLYHNELSVNFTFLSAEYSSQNVRGRFAVQFGSYVEANYAAEPDLWRNIFEAYAGYRIAENLWIDAGIFSSHIGAEGAVSKDFWTYSRSIVADYSPYYETGVKLSWSPSDEWSFAALALNGWQIIRETNAEKSFGTQAQWKPSGGGASVNWSAYLGNDQPDGAPRQMRYFSNLFVTFDLNERLSVLALFDAGAQERANGGGGEFDFWQGYVAMARYRIDERFSLAARAEYYSDPAGVIIPTGTPNNFQTLSASLNFDVALTPNLLWRVEGRVFSSRDAIYPTDGGASLRATDGFVATSFALWF
jgi:hypothetical protein